MKTSFVIILLFVIAAAAKTPDQYFGNNVSGSAWNNLGGYTVTNRATAWMCPSGPGDSVIVTELSARCSTQTSTNVLLAVYTTDSVLVCQGTAETPIGTMGWEGHGSADGMANALSPTQPKLKRGQNYLVFAAVDGSGNDSWIAYSTDADGGYYSGDKTGGYSNPWTGALGNFASSNWCIRIGVDSIVSACTGPTLTRHATLSQKVGDTVNVTHDSTSSGSLDSAHITTTYPTITLLAKTISQLICTIKASKFGWKHTIFDCDPVDSGFCYDSAIVDGGTPAYSGSPFTDSTGRTANISPDNTTDIDSFTLKGGTSLPTGTSLNKTTGAITGTYSAAGSFTPTIIGWRKGWKEDSVQISFTIVYDTLRISRIEPDSAMVGDTVIIYLNNKYNYVDSIKTGSLKWTILDSTDSTVRVIVPEGTGVDTFYTFIADDGTYADTSDDSVYIYEPIPPTQFNVTITHTGTGTTDPTGGEVVDSAASINISATAGVNYHFMRWSSSTGSITFGNSGNASTTATVSGAGTITAEFGIDSFTVSITTTTGGSVALTPAGGSYEYGTVVTVVAYPSAGYTFDRFSDDTACRNDTLIINGITKDYADSAYFVKPRINSYPNAANHVKSIFNGDLGSKLDFSHGIAGKGNYVFVAARNSNALNIFDISDIDNPKLAAIVDTGLTSAENVTIDGNYAYVAGLNGNAIAIIDIADPTHPVYKSAINGLAGANQIVLSESKNFAYVACLNGDSVAVIDVSNKSNPTFVMAIKNGGDAALDGANGLWYENGYLYCASYESNALEIMSTANEDSLVHIGKVYSTVEYPLSGPIDVQIYDSVYAVVIARYSDAVTIYDVSNHASPVGYSTISKGTGGMITEDPWAMHIRGHYLAVAAGTSNSVEMFDILDPKAPLVAGAYSSSEFCNYPLGVYFSAESRYVFAAASVGDNIEVIDFGAMHKNYCDGNLLYKLKMKPSTAKVKHFPFSVPTFPDTIYSELSSTGKDLHLYNDSGWALPYELKAVNKAGKTHAIWSKTNLTTDSTLVYILCGGDTAASSPLNVFTQFRGVYHLEDTSSANGLRGLTNSGVDFNSDGKIGKCGNWVSASSDKMTHDTAFRYERTEKFSFIGWVKRAATGVYHVVTGKLKNSSPYDGWEFTIRDNNKAALQLRGPTSGQLLIVDYKTTTIDTNWHQIGFSYSGTSTAAGINLYYDGARQDTTITNNALSESIRGTNTFSLGSRNGAALYMNGKMDETFFYDDAADSVWFRNAYNNQVGVGWGAYSPGPDSFSVQYNANGGSGSPPAGYTMYLAGGTVTVLSNTYTRTGYVFTGWNTAANGSGTAYAPAATFAAMAHVTLYARWRPTDARSVVVTPATATVQYGRTRLFTTTYYDTLGFVADPQPSTTWSVQGIGSIGAGTGLYTAGDTIATDTVIATYTTISDTAYISVVPRSSVVRRSGWSGFWRGAWGGWR